jgi:fatty acid desaturase
MASVRTGTLKEGPGAEYEQRLLGSTDVPLAPIRGRDPRRNLPAELFVKHPGRFAGKVGFGFAVIAAGYLTMEFAPTWAKVVAGLVLGLMYAHLVELQHEALHNHAFQSRRLNRLFGFLCGLFMLSSHSHYQYDHLRHHAELGTEDNHEFDHPTGFMRGMWHLGRYLDAARDMLRSVSGRRLPSVRDRANARIQAEYRLFALAILAVIAFTALTGSLLFVWAWLVPVLVVAEPTHFLIELPEHFGLNTQSDADVLANTRTIRASRFAQWFTNGNNLHTAHHFHQGVPMANVPRLQTLIDPNVKSEETSYWEFFRKVMTGAIKYDDFEATCMTR